jgi:putative acyl-CoA dehydrogenase
MGEFFQPSFELHDPYEHDRLLQLCLKTYLPNDVFAPIEKDLKKFSSRVVNEIEALGLKAEAEPPRLVQFDPWGKRIDRLEVSTAWQKLDAISAEEGLVAIAYQRHSGEFSRLHQFAKLYLFHPSSAYYTCPLAMTDGAAKLIEVHGTPELKSRAFKHLTSTDPKRFWTSGQWMTERSGGSDVSGTETRAEKAGTGYKLYGTKWFTSATTAQMAMTLAQVEGVKGLSLFYVETHNDQGHLDGIEVLRLKDKMGTRALPTAELKLNGVKAQLVGELGHGVRNISALFNITRIDNSIPAVATARRVLALLKDYSQKRVAFRHKLLEHPLHQNTMADMYADTAGTFLLSFHASRLLGLSECVAEKREENEKLLRLLTPLTKFFPSKLATGTVAEALEGFGGAGFIEDVGIARYYRDVIVLSIWEGTTNVLSLDVERALTKDGSWPIFADDVRRRLEKVKDSALVKLREVVEQELTAVDGEVSEHLRSENEDSVILRRLGFNMATVYIKSLLLELASLSHSPEVKAVLENWLERRPLVSTSNAQKLNERNRQILSHL